MSETTTETRDYLALVRTDLANERTLLAYGRTALMMAATGVTLMKFFPESIVIRIAGWPMLLAGIVIGVFGVTRFARLRSHLHPTSEQAPQDRSA